MTALCFAFIVGFVIGALAERQRAARGEPTVAQEAAPRPGGIVPREHPVAGGIIPLPPRPPANSIDGRSFYLDPETGKAIEEVDE